jgi:hypothetical protein
MMKKLSPAAVSVIGSAAILVIFLVIGAAIGGSYLLTNNLNQRNNQRLEQAIQQQDTERQQAVFTEQLHAAKGECIALRALDSSHKGIVFPHLNHAHPSERALTGLFKGIHEVYVSSQCPALLDGKLKLPHNVATK